MVRGRANGGAVVAGHVDDRNRNVRCCEAVSQVDARNAADVDVEYDANRVSKITVIGESFRRGE